MEQMNSGPIKNAKMVTFSPQFSNEQIISISQAQQNYPRTNIPQPIKTHPKLKNISKVHNHKQTTEDYICAKYNKCFHQTKQNQNRTNQKVFDIPRELLEFEEEDYQQIVDVLPEVGLKNYDNIFCDIKNNKIEEVDRFIQQELRDYARRARESKSKEKSLEKQRIQKISALNQKAKQILQKDTIKRKKFDGENPTIAIRPKWGHAIFNDRIQQQHQEPKKQIENKAAKSRKIQLKPTSDRIKDYEHKMTLKQQQQKRSQQCKHKHSNRTKDQAQIQSEISQDAKNLLKQKKQKQKEQKEKKLIIDAKIRAIQLQSIDSLKKFKKKPVDSTIQFVVDVPPPYSENQKKNKNKGHRKMSTKQVIQTEKIKKENVNSNVQKMKEYSERLRDTQREKNLLKSKQSSNNSQRVKEQHILNQQNNLITNEQMQKNSRFYIWNIPVYHQDLPKLQQHFYDVPIKFDKPKQKPFREQVREYLQEKFHKQQQQQIKKKKEDYFYELVEKKKQNYLDQYQYSNMRNGSHTNQVYWDEDEIFKHAPLSNFTQF